MIGGGASKRHKRGMARVGQNRAILAVLLPGLLISGCSSLPSVPVTTGAIPDAAVSGPVRGTPVVAGRPARMFIWAGFREKDCAALTPTFTLAQAAARGDVTFQPNQTTMIRHSNSGNCIGTSLPGTGIYYTARAGETGDDTFSVVATTPDGITATKTFSVRVIE